MVEHRGQFKTEDIPTYILLSQCSLSRKSDIKHDIVLINAYAERNQLFHNGIDEKLQKKKFGEVAEMLYQHEMHLIKKAPKHVDEEIIEALLCVIDSLKEQIFPIEEGDEDEPGLWIRTPLARTLSEEPEERAANKEICESNAAKMLAKKQRKLKCNAADIRECEALLEGPYHTFETIKRCIDQLQDEEEKSQVFSMMESEMLRAVKMFRSGSDRCAKFLADRGISVPYTEPEVEDDIGIPLEGA